MKQSIIQFFNIIKKWFIYSLIFGGILLGFSLLKAPGKSNGTWVEGSIDSRGTIGRDILENHTQHRPMRTSTE